MTALGAYNVKSFPYEINQHMHEHTNTHTHTHTQTPHHTHMLAYVLTHACTHKHIARLVSLNKPPVPGKWLGTVAGVSVTKMNIISLP